MALPEMQAAIEALHIEMTFQFVPFSQSRFKDDKRPCLNWRFTLRANGRDVLISDYMQGSGHIKPALTRANSGRPGTVHHENILLDRCERRGSQPAPKIGDVLYSLAYDADVIDHASFESWASDFGYDPDSRKAEAIYRACLETALKLRAAFGDAGLAILRNACQDY